MSENATPPPVAPSSGSVDPARPPSVGKTLSRLAFFVAGTVACVFVYVFLLSVTRGHIGSCVPAAFLFAGCLALNQKFLSLEQLSLATLGYREWARTLREMGVGFVLGTVLVIGWILVVSSITGAHWELRPRILFPAAANLVLFYLLNSGAEELAYRGYGFLKLEALVGRFGAILGTSILFALLHVQGGMNCWSAAAGVLTSGLIFSVLFAGWRSLPLALGAHLATNIVQDMGGLRPSPLSAGSLVQGAVSPTQESQILLAVAGLNLIVFMLLWWRMPGQKCRQGSALSG